MVNKLIYNFNSYVVMDKWDKDDNEDYNTFIIRLIEEGQHVLIICDKGYYDKAKSLQGDAKNSSIISPYLYNKIRHKCIIVVFEKSSNNMPYIPSYMDQENFIDMSTVEKYNLNNDLLYLYIKDLEYTGIRRGVDIIVNGDLDKYKDKNGYFKTLSITKKIGCDVERAPQRVGFHVDEFTTMFKNIIQECIAIEYKDCYLDVVVSREFDETGKPIKTTRYIDDLIIDRIADMISFRDDCVKYIELLVYANLNNDYIVYLFNLIFEELAMENRTSGLKDIVDLDHIKFFAMEVFLYAIVIAFRNKKYCLLLSLLNLYLSEYTQWGYRININDCIESLDIVRIQREKLDKSSVVADLLMERVTLEGFSKKMLAQIDLLLYYISVLRKNEQFWFPYCYTYLGDEKIDFLHSLKSKRFFNENFVFIKHLFKLSDVDEFKEMLAQFENSTSGYCNSDLKIPDIKHHISPNELCTLP